jgi:glucans biosynthesis protein
MHNHKARINSFLWRTLPALAGLWMMLHCTLFPSECRGANAAEAKAVAKVSFGLDHVAGKARELAKAPFKDPFGRIPSFLLEINYDQWRNIRYKPEQSLWRDEKLPFEVQFFHPGFYYNIPVTINIISSSGVKTLPFSTELFDYGTNDFKANVPNTVGFAGFRLHFNILTKTYKDEFLVFLGASYFRAIAKGQVYGLSARGIAIDTGLPSGEEFPFFKEFWIAKPGLNDKQITVYALLDSPSLTGAYRYVIKPGKETVLEVTSKLFRRNEKKMGIAALTSMFFYGENTNFRPVDDIRPEVHDSDGLQIALKSGEWLWRPLVNPSTLWVNTFQADNIVGFGLMQRDTNFDHYQDLETRPELRPSVWIQPAGDWGKGHVELIQIPTESHIHDNIVAFWQPDVLGPLNEPLVYEYTMRWAFCEQICPPTGRVTATRIGAGNTRDAKKICIDFGGGELETLKDNDVVEGVVSVPNECRLIEQQVFKNTASGGWRLVFQIEPANPTTLVEKVLPERKQIFEIRAFLRRGQNVLTETWSYGLRL